MTSAPNLYIFDSEQMCRYCVGREFCLGCRRVVGTRQLESFVKAVDRSLKAPVSVSRVKADVLSGVYSLRKLALLRKKHGF